MGLLNKYSFINLRSLKTKLLLWKTAQNVKIEIFVKTV